MARVEDSLVVPPLLSSFIFHETQLCTNDSWIFWFLLCFQAFLSPYLSAPWNWLRGALDSRITTRGWQHRWFHENDAPQEEYFQVERKTWVSIAPPNTCKCIPLLSHSHQTHCFIPASTHTRGCNSFHVTHSTQIPHFVFRIHPMFCTLSLYTIRPHAQGFLINLCRSTPSIPCAHPQILLMTIGSNPPRQHITTYTHHYVEPIPRPPLHLSPCISYHTSCLAYPSPLSLAWNRHLSTLSCLLPSFGHHQPAYHRDKDDLSRECRHRRQPEEEAPRAPARAAAASSAPSPGRCSWTCSTAERAGRRGGVARSAGSLDQLRGPPEKPLISSSSVAVAVARSGEGRMLDGSKRDESLDLGLSWGYWAQVWWMFAWVCSWRFWVWIWGEGQAQVGRY